MAKPRVPRRFIRQGKQEPLTGPRAPARAVQTNVKRRNWAGVRRFFK